MHKKLLFILLILWTGIFAVSAQTDIEWGNVNMDQSIDIIDALMTAQYYVGLGPQVFVPEAADVDGNGSITILDALMIAQYYVGLIDIFPVQKVSGVELLNSALERNLDPDATAEEVRDTVAGGNRFAFECYQELKKEEENLFFSPLSIIYAFGMCYAGANGNTEAEMAEVFHIDLPEERYHNALNDIELTIISEPVNPESYMGDELKLHLANSTWGQRDYNFQTSFLDILARYYGAGLNIVDFAAEPENCRILINDWVSEHTENRINNLLPQGVITSLTRLVLTNAIYFKANWFYPFDPGNTRPANFTLPDGSTCSVDMMNQQCDTLYKEVPGQYQMVRLSYQGTKRNAMYILLPAAGQFDAVENALSSGSWTEMTSNMTRYMVTLDLPKFTFEWASSLVKALHNLGMNDAFIPGAADFSGINGEYSLFISDVLHKSFIAVDEKGTEASAATAIVFSEVSMPLSATMTINRPFFFVISNLDTGAILFMGRVMTP